MLCADVVHRTSDLINSHRCFTDNRKEFSYIKTHLLGVLDVQSVQIYGLSVNHICTFSVVCCFPYGVRHLPLVNPEDTEFEVKNRPGGRNRGGGGSKHF